jgi:hypothetical protein
MVQTKGRFIDMAAVFFGESLQGVCDACCSWSFTEDLGYPLFYTTLDPKLFENQTLQNEAVKVFDLNRLPSTSNKFK